MELAPPSDLPPDLRDRFAAAADHLAGVDHDLPRDLQASAARVLTISQFVTDTLARQPEAVIERLNGARGPDAPAPEAALAEAELADPGLSEAAFMRRLRRERNASLAAIAWRDIAGLADLNRTLADLSGLADTLITSALDRAVSLLEPRYGRPGEPLLVLAMGKLGGRELNFSSDIDLILLYPDPPDDRREELEPYYLRLAQRLIRLLEQRTADGIVYRVDTRLRPFGSSGPLALSIGALEAYLMRHGRDWERYAYVKARLVTGQQYASELDDEVLRPFVFRRYLDYGVIEAMRQMKRLISEDVERNDKRDNIKLGRGGIREIEFIVQLFQLLRGGQDESLRSRNLLTALADLGRLGVIDQGLAEELADSYRLLRVTENRLQALDDRQTHELPDGAEAKARLAWALGYRDWAAFAVTLEAHRDRVQRAFDAFDWQGDAEPDNAGESIRTAWEAARLAESQNFPALAALDELRRSALHQRMDEVSRQRLKAFVGVLVPMLEEHPQAGDVLDRIMPVIRSVCRRSAYLSLLLENVPALERLLDLAAQSAMLTRLVAEHPLLLDELLDPRLFDAAPDRADIEHALERQLESVAENDTEALLEAMRDFQRVAIFRVAVADRFDGLPLMKVSDRLTDIAELVIGLALDIAHRELVARHGLPQHGDADDLEESALIVVAYGKLGGYELGYGSDLDLVFLHNSSGAVQESNGPVPVDNQRYFVRLVQRLIHYLGVQTSSGRLYEIDTRLRPDGASGLLVTTLTGFVRYQREQAWTWEHQALLRSRSVAGSASLRDAFERARVELLTTAVRRDDLAERVTAMRRRMRKELATGTPARFDIKQDPGGLADIEFLIDYFVLANAVDHPGLVTYPDNVRQLEALDAAGIVPAEDCAQLKQDYLTLRAETHELALRDGGRLVPAERHEALRARVGRLWRDTFGEEPD